MPWSTSTRRTELPPDWDRIRKAAFERDGYRCRQLDRGGRCEERATDVDHLGDRHDHSLANLQSLCDYHHHRKTIAEAHRAMRDLRAAGKHSTEAHPFTRRTMTERT